MLAHPLPSDHGDGVTDSAIGLDRFGPLLALTATMIAAMSLIDLDGGSDATWPRVAAGFVSLVIGVTLLLALRASGVPRRLRLAADVFVAIGVVTTIVVLVVELVTDADVNGFESDRPSPIWVALAVVTPAAVIRRLVQHRRVTRATMLGAVSAYLLIAVAFAYTFLYLDGLGDTAFFTDAADPPSTDFMYFSLVTITTVGYGDLAPATDLGQLLASTEAVVGQVYLVTFVAMLVGLRIQQGDRGATD